MRRVEYETLIFHLSKTILVRDHKSVVTLSIGKWYSLINRLYCSVHSQVRNGRGGGGRKISWALNLSGDPLKQVRHYEQNLKWKSNHFCASVTRANRVGVFVPTSIPGPSRWDGDEDPGKIRFIVPKFWGKNRMRSETQPYSTVIAIRLCRTAHAIFFPKFWNYKTNFTRVFVTVSPRRPWDRGCVCPYSLPFYFI